MIQVIKYLTILLLSVKTWLQKLGKSWSIWVRTILSRADSWLVTRAEWWPITVQKTQVTVQKNVSNLSNLEKIGQACFFQTIGPFCTFCLDLLLRTFVVCFRRQNLGSPSNGLKMEIVFKRRLTNELLTTYLPSFLLLLMAYATTFFKDFYFEAAVTVNLSILLVTTTLFVRWEIKRYYILWMRYINILLVSWKSFLQHPMSVWWIYGWSSVSWCLSSRSGWGLAMFCTCFAVVLYWCNFAMLKVTLTTVAELYNDDGNTINHHGFKRKIMKEGGKVKIHHTAMAFEIILSLEVTFVDLQWWWNDHDLWCLQNIEICWWVLLQIFRFGK